MLLLVRAYQRRRAYRHGGGSGSLSNVQSVWLRFHRLRISSYCGSNGRTNSVAKENAHHGRELAGRDNDRFAALRRAAD